MLLEVQKSRVFVIIITTVVALSTSEFILEINRAITFLEGSLAVEWVILSSE